MKLNLERSQIPSSSSKKTTNTARVIIERTLVAYEQIAEDFANRYFNAQLTEELERFSKYLHHGSIVIDVGCGVGRDIARFRDFRPIGLDISPAMLRVAREKGIAVPFVIGDMCNLPFCSKSADGTWACASLLHLPKSEAIPVLKEIHRLTRKVFFVSVIEGQGERWSEEVGGTQRYFTYYYMDELVSLLRVAGFAEKETWKKNGGDTGSIKWLNVIATTSA